MPHTAPATYAVRQDDCWLPARVARRMVAKHGADHARVLADAQRLKHKGRMRESEIRENTPFLIIYWDIAYLAIDKLSRRVPQPTRSAA